LGSYDAARPLTIDPILAFSTFYGNGFIDVAYDAGVDAIGNIYVAARRGEYFTSLSGEIIKFDRSGTQILSIYRLGGFQPDVITITSSGEIYAAGAEFLDYIAWRSSVLRINADGSKLLYKRAIESASGISGLAVAPDGSAYVGGSTNSTLRTTSDAFQPTLRGFHRDGFIARLSPTGEVTYATFLGGTSDDRVHHVALGTDGSVYVAGETSSQDFPVTGDGTVGVTRSDGTTWRSPRLDGTTGEMFFSKFSADGRSLLYSTTIATGEDFHGNPAAIAVDGRGAVWATGRTYRSNFPTTPNAQKRLPPPSGSTDAFVMRLNPSGGLLEYSSFLGANDGYDLGSDIALGSTGNVFVTGATTSTSFPVTEDAEQPLLNGGVATSGTTRYDAYLTEINGVSGALVYSTYLGGGEDESDVDVAVDSSGSAVLVGTTMSFDFPTRSPLQARYGGSRDMFVARFQPPRAPLEIRNVEPRQVGNGGAVTLKLSGVGLEAGATVRLTRAGFPDVLATTVRMTTATQLVADFDLHGTPPGLWNVAITSSSGHEAAVLDVLTIEDGGRADVWVQVIGRDIVRLGRPSTFYVLYGNRGLVNAMWTPLFIRGIPKSAVVEPRFAIQPPPSFGGLSLSPAEIAGLPDILELETEKAIPLLIPHIGPGETKVLRIDLTVTTSDSFELSARVGASLFGSAGGERDPLATADACISSGLQLLADLFGLIPGVECVEAASFTAASLMMEYYKTQFVPGHVISLVKIYAELASLIADCAKSVAVVTKILDGIKILVAAAETAEDCRGPASKLPVNVVSSYDPNAKIGPSGIGAARYLKGGTPFPYAIFFENKPTASAPAQEVTITDVLDPYTFDLDTFRCGPISVGDLHIEAVPNTGDMSVEVDLRPVKPVLLRVSCSVDKKSGLASWHFRSLDPSTGEPINDPLGGFLPANVNPPEGEGAVLFTVMPVSPIDTDVELRNTARIVFDANPPIDTPVWMNTIDNSPPDSSVQPLPIQSSTTFEVSWRGTDSGSGIQNYTIYASTNGGEFVPWLERTSSASALFEGQPAQTYAFYAVATDRVGNLEDAPLAADTSTATRLNTPPVAQGGDDRALEASSAAGEMVPLNGSGSVDVDGDALEFEWAGPFGTVSGRSADLMLPLGKHEIILTVTDRWGATSTDTVMITVRDTTAPTVACSGPDNQWHSEDVVLACKAEDVVGLADSSNSDFALRTNVPTGTEDSDATTGTRSVCDNYGNCTTAGPIRGNRVDKKGPTIAVSSPADTTYRLRQSVTAAYSCLDGGSGLANCAGSAAPGVAIDTSSVGVKFFTAEAVDAVGNRGHVQVPYTVAYGVVALFDQTKAHRAGSVVPVRLQLVDATGANMSSSETVLHAVEVQLVSTDASLAVIDAGSANPDSDFRFDVDTYIFNLKTTGLTTGTYKLRFTASADPTVHVVTFGVR
jgi:hypothetical protein